MKTAIIGLISSGKSTLLSAVSGKDLASAGSINIEEAMVPVPDKRLDWLTELYQPKKTVHATIDTLDLPGLSFADDSSRTAARRLFGHCRTVDMFITVLKGFEGNDPAKDLVELKTEFILSDLELVITRIEKLEKQVHKPTKTQSKDKAELALQLRLQEALEAEKPISSVVQHDNELDLIKSLGFLTLKPMMVVINVGEDELDKQFDLGDAARKLEIITLCAKLENELAQLDDQSRTEFMSDLGITKLAAAKFVQSCYKTLGLISFLTVGKDEVRAWPIRSGTSALDAAGKIHSDIKRGFIRAETIAYVDMQEHGCEKECKAAGKTRLEGKTYVVQDGDIINFRFNV